MSERELVLTIRGSDDQYLRWLAEHPDAYVVNSLRDPTPAYLQLHTADCHQISRDREPGAYTEHEYIKTCSTSRNALERWAREEVGGHLGIGCTCLGNK